MARLWLVICVVTACGAGSARRESENKPVAPAERRDRDDAAVAEIDVGEALVVTKDAGTAATPVDAGPVRLSKPCFCFSWVHLDENGQSCFPTKATCDASFKAFGRTDKIPCGEETERCGSYACRNIGKECFAL